MTADIEIRFVDPRQMRYATVGDWQDGDVLRITVAKQGDKRNEILVAIHELVEAVLCKHASITTQTVDAFDLAFAGITEPGDDPACPYRRQHELAEIVERIIARELDVYFNNYLDALTEGEHAATKGVY